MAMTDIQRKLDEALRQHVETWRAGDPTTLEAHEARLGPKRLGFPDYLVGAVVVGGFDFGLHVATAAARAQAAPGGGPGLLVRVLAEAYARHRHELGTRLVEAHALEGESAAVLLARLQATVGCLTAAGSSLESAVTDAVSRQQWGLALNGLRRLEAETKGAMAPASWGQMALCLHNLGRYAEASEAIAHGMRVPGSDGRPLSEVLPRPPEPPPEEVVLARWGGALTPRVTIICMTFNHVRYIEDTLRGFLMQETDFPYEIIVHDDASTDGTADVLRTWAARYPRLIRLIARERNLYSTGVYPITTLPGLPRGELIATCEGDDYWFHPGKLAKQAHFLFENPSFSCSGHNYLHFHEGLLTASVWRPGREDRIIAAHELMNLSMLWWMPWTLTMMYRAECFRFPPERSLASLGDQFMMSYLGERGPCMYFEGFIGAVRRENAFSAWSPLSAEGKEKVRLRTWMAIMAYHARRGNRDPVEHMVARLLDSKLPQAGKVQLYTDFIMKLTNLPPVEEA
jgi:glycosyltransferase involved in cell wall biosynthesis